MTNPTRVILVALFVAWGVVAFRLSAAQSTIQDVSMISLIAKPEAFDGKRVVTSGVLRIEFEGNILYLSKLDFDHRNSKNGLWIGYGGKVEGKSDLKEHDAYYQRLRGFTGRYVTVEATFSQANLGHLNCCSGALLNVTRVTPLE